MLLAFLTTDNRDAHRSYAEAQPRFGPAPTTLLQGLEMLGDAVEVHVVSCTQQPMTAPARIAPNIFYHSLVVPKIGWLKTGYQGCIRAVRRKLREIRPDIVHGQGTERDCSISAVFSGFPNVVTVHGNMRSIANKLGARPLSFLWLTAHLEKITLARTGGAICLTRYTEDQIGKLCGRKWRIPNAFPDGYDQRERVPASPLEILHPATLVPYKNQIGLIRALYPLTKRFDFRLLLAGKGQDSPYGTTVMEEVQKRSWVSYLGNLSETNLRTAYSKASIVVLPSLEDNCPMAALEAMAVGIPVVGARIGGIPDLIEDGVTGLLCDPTSEHSMRDAVERLLSDAALRERTGKAAKDAAITRHHPRVIAERHLAVYEEVAGGGKAEILKY